ncbi:four-carbon acid sugar kinase family protein [Microlunatus parietis]|uniref:4-hydroxythreonine-4-phosphate dehydrogenase n=1 Tax=Microlunatus parietis TaxID=682979 RepID=A0A7Y9LBR5_9ACTN|nr:four-carbon acid sugar kinase family protein [Microlunatus parietis]NYE74099.1 4-hydroxythreonine-4-phosphate dehydrogenase [Microlunatus parietis]
MTLRVTVIGDDLTGTVESAAVFHRYGFGGTIGIGLRPDARPAPGTTIWTVDTDTRQRPALDAAERARSAIRAAPAPLLIGKIDSLLRGRLVAHLAALDPDRYPLVFAPALPVQRRVVIGGAARDLDDGRPIGAAPLAELLAPLPTAVLPELAVPELAERIAQTAQAGRIALCDATDDAALDRIVAASLALPGVRYAGSAGLIAALARRLADTVPEPVEGQGSMVPGTSTGSVRVQRAVLSNSVRVRRAILFVVGTAAPTLAGQLDALTAAVAGTRVWTRPAGRAGWPERTAAEVRQHLAGDAPAVLRLPERQLSGPTDQTADADDAGLVAELAALTEHVLAGIEVPLVLTGGHTARAVLDRLGVDTLRLCAEIHHGAVALGAAGDRTVVTRPGSFGGPDSLVRILDRLSAPTRQDRP